MERETGREVEMSRVKEVLSGKILKKVMSYEL
jgi:hypothetical protein